VGFEPTIVSLEDAKRKGLNDLVESVQLDVMDLLDGQNLTYLNASHRIIGGGGYEFRYKFSISHCNTTQYRCNTVIFDSVRITVIPYRPSLLKPLTSRNPSWLSDASFQCGSTGFGRRGHCLLSRLGSDYAA
jgi:hypothetical protein